MVDAEERVATMAIITSTGAERGERFAAIKHVCNVCNVQRRLSLREKGGSGEVKPSFAASRERERIIWS